MGDTNNKTGVSEQSVPSSQPVGQSNPVGLAQKEQAPISSKVVSEISKIIEASEKEPRVPTEVREAGIETVTDEMPLTLEDKAVGIEHAGESTPVQTQSLGTVALPMDEEEALKIIKTTSNTDSRHWLAVLIDKIYRAVKSFKLKAVN